MKSGQGEGHLMKTEEAIAWLNQAARYFERKTTDGEDMAHWSNVQNAENCRRIAALIAEPKNLRAGQGQRACAECHGDGVVSRSFGFIPCPACEGRGH